MSDYSPPPEPPSITLPLTVANDPNFKGVIYEGGPRVSIRPGSGEYAIIIYQLPILRGSLDTAPSGGGGGR